MSRFQGDHSAFFHQVPEEDVTLSAGQGPLLVGLQVGLCGRDQPEHFLAFEDVIPDRRASEIDVEVGVAAFDAHQAVLLDFGVPMSGHYRFFISLSRRMVTLKQGRGRKVGPRRPDKCFFNKRTNKVFVSCS